jgi:hypothetical protein
MVQNSKNCKTQSFGNWICFRPQMKGMKTPTLWGPLERGNLIRTLSKGPNRVCVFLLLPEDGNRSSFRNLFSTVQNPSNSESTCKVQITITGNYASILKMEAVLSCRRSVFC